MTSHHPRAPAAPVALLAALFVAGIAFAQDKPDRPPWAQKPKPPSNSSSTDGKAAMPGIVPTPTQPISLPEDGDPQHGKIKVKVELVSILASVLDDHNRPS